MHNLHPWVAYNNRIDTLDVKKITISLLLVLRNEIAITLDQVALETLSGSSF